MANNNEQDKVPVDIVRLEGPPYDATEFTVPKGGGPMWIEFGLLTDARLTGEIAHNHRVPEETTYRYVLDDESSVIEHDVSPGLYVLKVDPWPYNDSD